MICRALIALSRFGNLKTVNIVRWRDIRIRFAFMIDMYYEYFKAELKLMCCEVRSKIYIT